MNSRPLSLEAWPVARPRSFWRSLGAADCDAVVVVISSAKALQRLPRVFLRKSSSRELARLLLAFLASRVWRLRWRHVDDAGSPQRRDRSATKGVTSALPPRRLGARPLPGQERPRASSTATLRLGTATQGEGALTPDPCTAAVPVRLAGPGSPRSARPDAASARARSAERPSGRYPS